MWNATQPSINAKQILRALVTHRYRKRNARKYNANTRRRNALESIMPTRANDTQVHVKTVTQATVHHVTYAHRLHAVALAACALVCTRGVGAQRL
jgi:hypothetical protein